MRLPALVALAAFALATVVFAQEDSKNYVTTPLPSDLFQVRYAANLNQGDSFVNITNSGTSGANICVNVYTFDVSEEMVSCCSCVVTPNALVSLSVQGDLISNTLSPSTPTSVVIKLLAWVPSQAPDLACNGGVDFFSAGDAPVGLRAWGATLHGLPGTPTTYGVTEGSFLPGGLSFDELDHLSTFCGFIQSNGSGFGICKSCRAGGLGGAKQ